MFIFRTCQFDGGHFFNDAPHLSISRAASKHIERRFCIKPNLMNIYLSLRFFELEWTVNERLEHWMNERNGFTQKGLNGHKLTKLHNEFLKFAAAVCDERCGWIGPESAPFFTVTSGVKWAATATASNHAGRTSREQQFAASRWVCNKWSTSPIWPANIELSYKMLQKNAMCKHGNSNRLVYY